MILLFMEGRISMPEYWLILIRTLVSYALLFVMARSLGKRQISQLTFFDYVVGIVIGDMASSIAIDTQIKMLNGIIGLVVYSLLTIVIAFGAIKSFRFRNLVDSRPAILVEGGKILEDNLLKNQMTVEDLMSSLREKNAFKLEEVELAVLETNGQLSVMKKSESEPVTRKDLGLAVEEEKKPSIVIVDGKLLGKRLKNTGYTEEWLLQDQKQGQRHFRRAARVIPMAMYLSIYTMTGKIRNRKSKNRPYRKNYGKCSPI